jgi:ectoine hydroxylase-related dioxygenase (phytanoyl-CoA dioxygenase family)
MQDLVAELDTDGYTIVRGFLSPQEAAEISEETHRLYQEGPKHRATYRHKNLLFEVLDDPEARRRVVLQAHWTAWISPLMERMRRSEQYFTVLEPFLGPDIKQISHQVHWKPPGAKYTSYRFHQDARFREGNIKDFGYLRSTVTTGLAIDRQTAENGALRVMPESHRAGYRRARRVGVSRRRFDSARTGARKSANTSSRAAGAVLYRPRVRCSDASRRLREGFCSKGQPAGYPAPAPAPALK